MLQNLRLALFLCFPDVEYVLADELKIVKVEFCVAMEYKCKRAYVFAVNLVREKVGECKLVRCLGSGQCTGVISGSIFKYSWWRIFWLAIFVGYLDFCGAFSLGFKSDGVYRT